MRFNPTKFNQERFNGNTTTDRILALPKAVQGEFEMSDKEVERTRRLIYWINKNHPKGHRYRTMRDGTLLLVWRIS